MTEKETSDTARSPRTGRAFVYRSKPRKPQFQARVSKFGARAFPHAPRVIPLIVFTMISLFVGFLAVVFSEVAELAILEFYDEMAVGYSQPRRDNLAVNFAIGVLTFVALTYTFYRRLSQRKAVPNDDS
ncbi:hypothetical protein [Ruegeria sp.]|uniref:hypothetical protein n=1 Tax=Ruegeria sp. TaxID=1879320 RepID=UPI003C7E9F1C